MRELPFIHRAPRYFTVQTKVATVCLEAIVIIGLGAGLALAANGISPRGLVLTRNYAPPGTNTTRVAPRVPLVPASNNAAQEEDDAKQLSDRLHDKGLQELKLPQTEIFFHQAEAHPEQIVFIDARNEDNYGEGHLPGAYELNPYYPEKYLATVLPICQAAAKVVVYCTGGDCEDSDTAAILLREGGVSNEKIFVYGGGYTEWHAQNLPLVSGPDRNSGPAAK